MDIYKIIEMFDPDWFKKPVLEIHSRILYAEDSSFYAQLVKNYLEGAGYEVEIAEDGVRAWEKLQEGAYDLLITDIEMPRMNGLELIKKVRADERFRDLPIMVLTSISAEEVYRKAKELGADEFQTKLDRQAVIEAATRLLTAKTTAEAAA